MLKYTGIDKEKEREKEIKYPNYIIQEICDFYYTYRVYIVYREKGKYISKKFSCMLI